MVEPYLLQRGFVRRTRRGREITRAACEHLGLKIKITDNKDLKTGELFEQ
jgi:Holliday junction DNA helicase RuvB